MGDKQAVTTPAHEPGTNKGEELVGNRGKEAGREDTGTNEAGRPTGTRTARDATSINPTDPIDPASPHMPPA